MFSLCSRVFCHGSNLNKCLKNSYRTLYSANALGLDIYVQKREKAKEYFANDIDKLREKMIEFVNNDENSMVFAADLKNMIHLADGNDKDLDLIEKMLKIFNKQSKEIRIDNFTFGPIVMRFFYHINNADFALKLFKDPEFEGFFDQLKSYQILVDMLYELGRYQDVIDVFQVVKSRHTGFEMYPREVVLLVFAACYKENTPESFKFSTKLWSELINIGLVPIRRAVTFAATLAIRQNSPHVGMQIIGVAHHQNYVTVRNIKVLALTNLGRLDDALFIVKSILRETDTTNKQTFTKHVIDNLNEAVNKSGNNEMVQDFSRIEKILIQNGHITDTTLEELLTSQITVTRQKKNDLGNDRNSMAASNKSNNYSRHKNYEWKKPQFIEREKLVRPGLADFD